METIMKEVLCVCCPFGCLIQVETPKTGDTKAPQLKGYRCQKGQEYAMQELLNPVRTLTAVICVDGSRTPLSVKTSIPIPKNMFMHCIMEAQRLKLRQPISLGTILIHNIAGTGADLLATCEL